MSFVVKNDEDGGVVSVFLNGEELEFDGETCCATLEMMSGLSLSDFPDGIDVLVCDKITEILIIANGIHVHLLRNGDQCRVLFEDSGRRKGWDGMFGYGFYMNTKASILKETEHVEFDDMEDFVDDGENIHLFFSTHAELSETVEQVVTRTKRFLEILEEKTQNDMKALVMSKVM